MPVRYGLNIEYNADTGIQVEGQSIIWVLDEM